jgi:hypothetical protein
MTAVLFLLKCVIVLGLVLLAIAAREGEGRDPRSRAAGRPPAPLSSGEVAATVGAARAAFSNVADRAAGRVAEAARDHCLAHPLDCLHAAEKLQGAKTDPGRR